LSFNEEPEKNYRVALFYSVSGALRAEKLLKAENVAFKLIPVPRHLSSDCGICVRFETKEESRVKKVLIESNLDIQGICPL
jgi:hypothetical protein